MIPFRVAFVQGRPRFGKSEENLERGLTLARTVATRNGIMARTLTRPMNRAATRSDRRSGT